MPGAIQINLHNNLGDKYLQTIKNMFKAMDTFSIVISNKHGKGRSLKEEDRKK